MAADRAGRRAGRIEQHGVERAALPLGGVGRDDLGAAAAAARDSARTRASRGAERSTAVTARRPAQAARSCRRARRTGRRRLLAAHVAEQPRRQRGGGVLHPPGAFVVARQLRTSARCDGRAPCRSAARGRASAAAQLAASHFTVRSSAGSWRVRDRDRARGVVAVVARPALHQPVRRIERHGVELGEQRRAVAREPAQHRVDEAGIARGAAVGLRQPHATDRRRRDPARRGTGFARRRSAARSRRAAHRRRKAAFERTAEQMAQRAEPAQHGRDERPHQRAVALGQRAEIAAARAARRAAAGAAARCRRCRPRCGGRRGRATAAKAR